MDELEAPQASFASQVRGTTPHDLDAVLAAIAEDVYLDPGSNVYNWRPLSGEELQEAGVDKRALSDTRSGFTARLYTNHDGDVVLAFRGSNEGKDWFHNIGQGIGFDDAQYEAAEKAARKAYDAFGGKLVMTGHSLGGGLATLGSVVTGSPAVTFNSSGLSDQTIRRQGRDPDVVRQWAQEGSIRRYAIDHEILTTLQEGALLTRGLLPDAIGHKIELPDPHPLHGWEKLVPGNSLRHGVHLHGMASVIEAQQLANRDSIANPAHPQHRLFNDAFNELKKADRETLGFRSEDEYRRAAGSLTVKAQQGGLHRIDHVVVGANGKLFAVEGPLESASHRLVGVDKGQAAAQSIEASSKLLQPPTESPAQSIQPERHRHAVALP